MSNEIAIPAAHGAVVYTPDPNRYHNPSDSTLSSSGKAVSSALPRRYGLSGVILPRSTTLGGSKANPTLEVGEITVCDWVTKGELHVDMNELKHADLERMILSAEGEDYPTKTYNIFKSVSREFPRDNKPLPTAKPVQAQQAPSIVANAPVPQETWAEVVELATEPQQTTMKPLPSVILAGARMPQQEPVTQCEASGASPPKCRVTFELNGFGTFETSYHHVVCGEDGVSLVLVYDNRFKDGMKYFPQASDNDMFVDVHDLESAFKVKSTGMKYTVGNFDHCILLIESQARKE